jgi:hypothetical protein
MNRLRRWRTPLIVLGLATGASASVPALADCVIQPSPPPPPPGCGSMIPDCICDEQGQSCHWIFHCVPNK